MTRSKNAGKTVLVIGASSGIGEATAKYLADRGHKVFGTSRDSARIKLDGVQPLSLDVFDEISIDQTIKTVMEQAGRIDGLVYSAGYYVSGAVEEISLKAVQDQLYAYFFGAVRCAQSALPHMRAAGSGRFVFMSSTAGTIAIPFHSAYSASKGALGRWSEAFAYEVAPFNINVSYIEAGPIQTNAPNAMQPPANPIDIYAGRRSRAEEAFKASIGSGLKPVQVAKAVTKAIEDRRNRVRYRVGTSGKVFPILQAALGERMFRRLMSKSFGI